jgi:putative spermidine/putrescine transport system substrate-binding protein
MSKGRWRRLHFAGLAIYVVIALLAATSCGGGDDNESSGTTTEDTAASTAIPGLGANLDEIKQKARGEGMVNLVIWAGYADKSWAKTFTQQTGCKVVTKDGASSDDMVDLMGTGAYDGVSASGDATLRMIARGDVAPVNFDLTPNYADVFDGLKNRSYNTVDGQGYGVPHGRGPNLLVFRKDKLPAGTDSWAPVWDGSQAGKLSIYDNPIFIADAAVYLKSTQPDLEIENPYELDQKQFDAAVDLLKKQRPQIAKYWDGTTYASQVTTFKSGQTTVGTTWPYQTNLMAAEKPPVPVSSVKPKEGTTGWSDTWMIAKKAKHPNCMYLWMNYIISPAANAKVAEYFGEAPSNEKACALTADKDHCNTYHATDEAWWKDVYYWDTPVADCGDDRGDNCKTYEDWKAAWTEIKG